MDGAGPGSRPAPANYFFAAVDAPVISSASAPAP